VNGWVNALFPYVKGGRNQQIDWDGRGEYFAAKKILEELGDETKEDESCCEIYVDFKKSSTNDDWKKFEDVLKSAGIAISSLPPTTKLESCSNSAWRKENPKCVRSPYCPRWRNNDGIVVRFDNLQDMEKFKKACPKAGWSDYSKAEAENHQRKSNAQNSKEIVKKFEDGKFERSPFDGLSPGAFPSSVSRTPFKWTYLGKDFDMEMIGGILGVQQQQNGALRPAIGWAITHKK